MRALITGGQQGIGLGIARALHGAGFDVALAAEVPEGSDAVQSALAELQGATYHRHDLRDIAAIPAVLKAIGPITTLIANAGVASLRRDDLLDLAPDSFDHVMGINLRGTFFLAQAVARRMLGQAGYRSMCFVTSVSAGMASPDRADYCMSKAAAAMMVRTFALRLAGDGIGVFDLRPGIIETAMTVGVRAKYDARLAEGLVPAGRWGTPADIGAVVVPLATGQMAFATGSVIAVDGGLSVPRL